MSGMASWKAKIELDIEDLRKQIVDAENSIDKFANEERKVKLDIDTKTLESAIQKLDKMLDSLGKGTGDFKQFENLSKELSNIVSEVQSLSKAFGKVDDSGTKTLLSSIQNIDKSLSELSQNILNVNKNMDNMGGNTSGAVKEIEDITNESKQAAKALDDVAKAQAKVNGGKTNISSGNSNSVNLNKYDSRLNSYQAKYSKYQDTLTRFKDGGWTSDAYAANVDAVEQALKRYNETLNQLKGQDIVSPDDIARLNQLEQALKGAISTVQNMSAAEKGFDRLAGQKELDRINKILEENSRMSTEAKAKIQAYYDEIASGNPSASLGTIHGKILEIVNAEQQAGRAGKSFLSTIKDKAWYGWAGQLGGMVDIFTIINGVKSAINTIVELDDALVDLKKTTAMNESQLEDFYYDANDVAKQMGVTTEEIITQASAWSRLGYSSQEAATTMAKLSSKFASISPGMSTDEAQEGLVSIMKAFDIDPDDVETEIMDKINTLGNKFAENNQDVVEGLKRSAAAMSAMGQSFTDTAALFTGGMEILQDSESMGTALRTLSMRIRGYDEETEQLSDDLVNVTGEVADLTKTAQDSQGVSLFTDATQEHYRSMVEYLGDIADRWDQISEKNQTEFCLYVQKCA